MPASKRAHFFEKKDTRPFGQGGYVSLCYHGPESVANPVPSSAPSHASTPSHDAHTAQRHDHTSPTPNLEIQSNSTARPATRLAQDRSVPRQANILSAAIGNQQLIAEKREEAKALKRKRELESQPGYKSLSANVKKYKYTGPDPSDGGYGPREGAGTEAEASGKQELTPGTGRQDAAATFQRGVEPGMVHPIGCDEDDNFDKNKYITDPIKPFKPMQPLRINHSGVTESMTARRPILQREIGHIEDEDGADRRTRQWAHGQAALSDTRQLRPSQGKLVDLKTSKSALVIKQRPPPMPVLSQKRPPSRVPAASRPIEEEEYADDEFDQLLAAATVFDDGTDIYADEGFDMALEAALVNGLL